MGFGGGKKSAPIKPVTAPPEPAGAPATDQNIERPVIQNRREGTPTQLLGSDDTGGHLLAPKKANTY